VKGRREWRRRRGREDKVDLGKQHGLSGSPSHH